MTIRVLGIGDTANLIAVLQKFSKKSKIDLIQIKNIQYPGLINKTQEVKLFESEKTLDQVNELLRLTDRYDFFIVTSWSTARLAYLAGLKFIWLFNGDDIRHPFFVKDAFHNLNFLERWFHKKVFGDVTAYVAVNHDPYFNLKRFVKEPILLHQLVDTTLYNPEVKPIELTKDKFTFFSPARIGYPKGTDVIWSAIAQCKSDFDVLQVEWYETYPPELAVQTKKLLEIKPRQVKLIPLIKHSEMAQYYKYADVILGQISIFGGVGFTEQEPSFCKKPVITYPNPEYKFEINGKLVSMPFYPKTRDVHELTEVIDRMVTSETFRDRIAQEGYEFVNAVHNPVKQAEKFENLFEKIKEKYFKKRSTKRLKLRKIFFLLTYYSNIHRTFSKIQKK